MTTKIGLAALTVLDLAPPEMIHVAAEAGYDFVGLRLVRVMPGSPGYPLESDPALMRDTLAALAATGLSVGDIEVLALREDPPPDSYRAVLEAGARLGAKHALVAGYDPDRPRLVARFAALCAVAAECGITANLEFMPWSQVPNLTEAAAVVTAAQAPNAGVLVDALHFDRSHSTLPQLAALPPHMLHYWQACDAPAEHPRTLEDMLHTARAERLFPGEGGLNLQALLHTLPTDLPVALEIPTTQLAFSVSHLDRAKRALAAARGMLGVVG